MVNSKTGTLGDNTIEDATWLCSLSESELDMLMSLKKLVLQHAKVIGHEELANKFDLKMLRAIGLILMENVKQKTADASSLINSLSKSATRLEKCNLLNTNLQENMDIKEIMTCLGTDSKRRRRKRCLKGYIEDITHSSITLSVMNIQHLRQKVKGILPAAYIYCLMPNEGHK
ncbi:hypothetical protein ACFE04_000345 [Oxalis oulophora]